MNKSPAVANTAALIENLLKWQYMSHRYR